MLRSAQPGRNAAWTGTGARYGTPADRMEVSRWASCAEGVAQGIDPIGSGVKLVLDRFKFDV